MESLHPVYDELAERSHGVFSLGGFSCFGHDTEMSRNEFPDDREAPGVGDGALDHLDWLVCWGSFVRLLEGRRDGRNEGGVHHPLET